MLKRLKRTKIIATYGPAIASKHRIKRLVDLGVNLFRINCSHGERKDFLEAASLINEATRSCAFPVGLLFDLSGPKLRLDRFTGQYLVEKGSTIKLSEASTLLSKGTFRVNHPGIVRWARRGERIYIDDGNLIFEVTSKRKGELVLQALNSGLLLPGKGINLPDSRIDTPTLTRKDRRDLKCAIEARADFVALSFVRSSRDVLQVQRLVKRWGGDQKVIAKLEKREAVEKLEEIVEQADGVMVARGDLGVELPQELLPKLQKRIIALANTHLKPVIVATQMLESMRHAPRATRAEINDVASAVFDHADAVMLSAETATGNYPLEAVATMEKVIGATEPDLPAPAMEVRKEGIKSVIPLAIADAVSRANRWCKTKLIFAFTTSGFTAEMISNLFPAQPVIALTPDPRVLRRLVLCRSVHPIRVKQPRSMNELFSIVEKTCKGFALARKGDKVIITGGAPFGVKPMTNMMMIHEI